MINNKKNYLKQFIFPPRDLTEVEESEMQKLSGYIIVGAVERKEFFALLFNFFSSENFSEDLIKKYYTTYWLWFVQVAFKDIYSIEPKKLLMFFIKILPLAFSLKIDVSGKFLDYLYSGFSNSSQSNEFGRKLKIIIESSDVSVNIFSSESVSYQDLSQKIKMGINQDKVVDAILFGKIEEGIMKNSKIERTPMEKINITNNFVNFVNFIVKTTDFNEVVAKYFRALEGRGESLEEDLVEDLENVEVKENKTLDYKKIKDEVIAKFGEVDSENVGEVLDYLGEEYKDVQDENIKQLIYFDENMGKFKWSEDLLV